MRIFYILLHDIIMLLWPLSLRKLSMYFIVDPCGVSKDEYFVMAMAVSKI